MNTDKLAEAEIALKKRDFIKADKLFAEIEETEKFDLQQFAQIAFNRGAIAEQALHWHDAFKHYARAAQLAPSFKTLITAQRLAFDVGYYDSALSFGHDAQKAAVEEYGEESAEYSGSLNNIAVVYEKQEQYKKSEPLYLQALEINKKIFGEEHIAIADNFNNLAGTYYERGDYKKAESFYQQALEIYNKILEKDDLNTAITLNNLAGVYYQQGFYQKAEPLLIDVLRIRQKALNENHPAIANSLNSLAALYHKQKRYKEGEPLLLQAIQILETTLGDEHPHTKLIKSNYEEFRNSPALVVANNA